MAPTAWKKELRPSLAPDRPERKRWDPDNPPSLQALPAGGWSCGPLHITEELCPLTGLPAAAVRYRPEVRSHQVGAMTVNLTGFYAEDWPSLEPLHPLGAARRIYGAGPGTRGEDPAGSGHFIPCDEVGLDETDAPGGRVLVHRHCMELLAAGYGGRFRDGAADLFSRLLAGDLGEAGDAAAAGAPEIPAGLMPLFPIMPFARRARMVWEGRAAGVLAGIYPIRVPRPEPGDPGHLDYAGSTSAGSLPCENWNPVAALLIRGPGLAAQMRDFDVAALVVPRDVAARVGLLR